MAKKNSMLAEYLKNESASGVLLLICTVIAISIANSTLATAYNDFWHFRIEIPFGFATFGSTLAHWVNDGLMAVFFFVVGLEIKREFTSGELSTRKKAALPIVGALGGMVVPAVLYLLFASSGSDDAPKGWGIATATDIAFAVSILALAGSRVPVALKVFLLALAIADDIGAVIVIAVFYVSHLNELALGIAALVFVLLYLGNRKGIRSMWFYAVFGIILWMAILPSGVHGTIAGVLTALLIPNTRLNEGEQSPAEKFEDKLHEFSSFIIMPIFALVNAAVSFSGLSFASLAEPVTLGVIAGLVVGKPLGISLFALVAEKCGIVSLPEGVRRIQLVAVSVVAGVGFTMSLFIAGLAYPLSDELANAKVGILTASLLAGVLGYLIVVMFGRSKEEAIE